MKGDEGDLIPLLYTAFILIHRTGVYYGLFIKVPVVVLGTKYRLFGRIDRGRYRILRKKRGKGPPELPGPCTPTLHPSFC